jgi:hypothetical protein
MMDLLELYEERAGVMEYEAGMGRRDAERRAFADLLKRYGPEGIPEEVYEVVRKAIYG